jgi:broad-like protein
MNGHAGSNHTHHHSHHHAPSSPPDKYNVRWTTHHAETWSAFSSLLAAGRFVDVTLCCRNRTFKAHRVVLSACSPYLRELLDSDAVTGGVGGAGPQGASHPILILQDATPEAVEHVIEFMYTGNVDIPSRCLSDFIKLAECFQVGVKTFTFFSFF